MSDIYAQPGEDLELELDGAPTGLVGTLTVAIYDTPTGTTILAPTTAGIVEFPAGSGLYAVTIVGGVASVGKYSVVWDNAGTFARDTLTVSGNVQPPIAPSSAILGYATVSHVETYHPARAPFTGSTKPSDSRVVGAILDVCAELDVKLTRAGYDTPVPAAATAAFLWCRSIVSRVAAYRVELIAPSSPETDDYRKMSNEAWAAASANDLELPGLAKNLDETRIRFPTPVPTAMFTRDMVL